MNDLELKVLVLNSRLHALETLFLLVYPDKKQDLEDLYVSYLKEAQEYISKRLGSSQKDWGPAVE